MTGYHFIAEDLRLADDDGSDFAALYAGLVIWLSKQTAFQRWCEAHDRP